MPFGLEVPIEEESACPYLPGRQARYRAVSVEALPPNAYHSFMDAGFRRSGHVLYQPVCRGCRSCIPLRVASRGFVASATQRRCLRRNADLRVVVDLPLVTEEKLDLYNRYSTVWHGGATLSLAGLEESLYESCVETIEFTYRAPDGELLAVGLCDVAPKSLSSVYFYFAPESAARGLGTYGVLRELDYAAQNLIPDYYLGYWIADCDSMRYKSNYGPHEFLGLDGRWGPALVTLAQGGYPSEPPDRPLQPT